MTDPEEGVAQVDRPSLLIGVGNRDRGDDSVGPIVCDIVDELGTCGLRTLVLESSVVDLSTYWEPDDRVVVVDAAQPQGRPGRIVEYDGLADRFVVPATMSTHSFDVSGAIELARAMNRLPASLTIVAVEAESFEFGAAPTPCVQDAIGVVVTGLSRLGATPSAGS